MHQSKISLSKILHCLLFLTVTVSSFESHASWLSDRWNAVTRTVRNPLPSVNRIFANLARETKKAGGDTAATLKKAGGDTAATLKKAGGDTAATLKKAGGDTAATLKKASGDTAATLKKAGGDTAATLKKAGNDVSQEWKNLPQEVRIGIIVAAAAAGGYFAAPYLGAQFSASLAINMGSGTVVIPIATTAQTGALITGLGAGAASAATMRKEKSSEPEKAKVSESTTEENEENEEPEIKKEPEQKTPQKTPTSKPHVAEEFKIPTFTFEDSFDFQSSDIFDDTKIKAEDLPKGGDLPDTLNLGDKLKELVKHYCFVAGTKVRTPKGHVAIETLQESDLVVSCNFAGQQCSYQPIAKTLQSEAPVLRVAFELGQPITTTTDHPFFVVEENSFIPAQKLEVGTHVLTVGGESLSVIDVEDISSTETVYNLEVAGFHNYYVSAANGEPQDILVHNCDEHDCSAIENFADTAKELYAQLSVNAAAACAASAAACVGAAVTPGGQVLATGVCPTTMPLCELALGSAAASAGAGGFGAMLKEGMEDGKSSLPRYDGPKPSYHINPQHVKGPKFVHGKTPLPDDAEAVFKKAVPDDAIKAKHWYGKNKDGVIYRFSNANDGTAHFSGRSDFGDGIRNLSDYVIERLKDL